MRPAYNILMHSSLDLERIYPRLDSCAERLNRRSTKDDNKQAENCFSLRSFITQYAAFLSFDASQKLTSLLWRQNRPKKSQEKQRKGFGISRGRRRRRRRQPMADLLTGGKTCRASNRRIACGSAAA